MATIAVFVALGGSSYAVTKISGSQISNNSISYKKLKRNTLGGSRIRESRLGTVPRARRADLVGGLSGARLRLRCPAGTRFNSDVCVELSARKPLPYSGATGECEFSGRRLPTHQELFRVVDDSDVALAAGGELTADVYPSGSAPGSLDVLTVVTETGGVELAPDKPTAARAFRCVVDPSN